jgi:hypothetical protein
MQPAPPRIPVGAGGFSAVAFRRTARHDRRIGDLIKTDRAIAAASRFHRSLAWLNVANVELHEPPELVPVEALRAGDPITDVHGGGQHYTVLESKAFGKSCVVLELESKVDDQLRVIEMSFPAGYHMGRSPRRIL